MLLLRCFQGYLCLMGFWRYNEEMDITKTVFRCLLAAVFVAAGAYHFRNTPLYERVMPPYLPYPRALVLVSGACEITGGLGVLLPLVRRPAGWGLIALLIAVFPANVHMALHPNDYHIAPWLLWLRLPMQGVLIAWVWWTTLQGPMG